MENHGALNKLNSLSNSLWEELTDEELATCVGGTGILAVDDKKGRYLDPDKHSTDIKVAQGKGKIDPNGSTATTRYTYKSDRAVKEHLAPVDGQTVLERVASLPITTWNYKGEDPDIRHIGPMAQDFAAVFNVGDSDRSIHAVDANGVALAAIQGLYKTLQEKDAQIAALQTDVNHLKQSLATN